MASLGFQSAITQQVSRGQAKNVHDYPYLWRYRHDKSAIFSDTYRITIPAGYIYNGASIPRFLWSIFGVSPFGAMDTPSLVHDYIYEHKGKVGAALEKYDVDLGRFVPANKRLTRRDADYIFLWVMQDSGFFKQWRIEAAYKAVALLGQTAWNDDD